MTHAIDAVALAKALARPADAPRRRAQRRYVTAETLERRRLLSGSYTFSTLASFDLYVNGANPFAGVTLDAAGNLYGTTQFSVFEIARGSTAITALAKFGQAFDPFDPSRAAGGVTLDADGNLYGTMINGGTMHLGVVFETPRGGGTPAILASFTGDNGQYPLCTPVLDSDGNLYGTTSEGGTGGAGTVFEIPRGSNTITTLVSFDGSNGGHPDAALILGADGNLYGTTDQGGAHNLGTVFEIAKGSTTATTLASFDGANGSSPRTRVTLDSVGNLYGTTNYGGTSGLGTVFEIIKGSNIVTTVVSFNVDSGYMPSGVVLDANGDVFGTTEEGGPPGSYGTVFEIAKGSNIVTMLASFTRDALDQFPNGAYPRGGVTLDAVGNLYGTTIEGGAHHSGTVFKLSPRRPGDANADGKVDFADLLILAQNYGKTSATFAQGDFDGNGSVGFPDLLILAQNYGRGTAPTTLAGTLLTRSKHARRLVR